MTRSSGIAQLFRPLSQAWILLLPGDALKLRQIRLRRFAVAMAESSKLSSSDRIDLRRGPGDSAPAGTPETPSEG